MSVGALRWCDDLVAFKWNKDANFQCNFPRIIVKFSCVISFSRDFVFGSLPFTAHNVEVFTAVQRAHKFHSIFIFVYEFISLSYS